MQVKAREIVNSEEYQSLIDQNKSFISKIHSKKFYTEDLFDVGNETYNYDVIRERLSMTSFKSVEEFVQEYEKMFYSVQELVKKNPDFTNSSLQKTIEEEIIKTTIFSSKKNRISSCDAKLKNCRRESERVYLIAQGLCFVLSGPAIAICTGAAIANAVRMDMKCDDDHDYCTMYD